MIDSLSHTQQKNSLFLMNSQNLDEFEDLTQQKGACMEVVEF